MSALPTSERFAIFTCSIYLSFVLVGKAKKRKRKRTPALTDTMKKLQKMQDLFQKLGSLTQEDVLNNNLLVTFTTSSPEYMACLPPGTASILLTQSMAVADCGRPSVVGCDRLSVIGRYILPDFTLRNYTYAARLYTAWLHTP